MISFALDSTFHGLSNDILDPYKRFILSEGVYLEKCGNFWENGHFSGRIWPDWGNTAPADMAGLGSIGLKNSLFYKTNAEMYQPFCL